MQNSLPLIRKTRRRAIKFLKYALLSGRPLVIIGAPAPVSPVIFKKFILSNGHCFASSFYSAKTMHFNTSLSGTKLLPKPTAFLILNSGFSKAGYSDFVSYARNQKIPIINFAAASSPHCDYSYFLHSQHSSNTEVFLCWLTCRLLKFSFSKS